MMDIDFPTTRDSKNILGGIAMPSSEEARISLLASRILEAVECSLRNTGIRDLTEEEGAPWITISSAFFMLHLFARAVAFRRGKGMDGGMINACLKALSALLYRRLYARDIVAEKEIEYFFSLLGANFHRIDAHLSWFPFPDSAMRQDDIPILSAFSLWLLESSEGGPLDYRRLSVCLFEAWTSSAIQGLVEALVEAPPDIQ